MSSALTDEQRARIQKNREEAIRRREERLAREKADASSAAQPVQNRPVPPETRPPLTNNATAGNAPSVCSTAPSTSLPKPTFPIFTGNNDNKVKESFWKVQRAPTMAHMPKSNVKVVMKFINSERVKVTFQPFHQSIVDAIKTIRSRQYEEKDRSWNIKMEDIRPAQTILAAVKECNVEVEPIPDSVLQAVTNFKLEPVPEDLSTLIDRSLVQALFPYQKVGVRFGLAHAGRVLIADEMGLGKSIQALAIARYYKAEWPLMIVCPSSVKAAWKNQLTQFMPYITRIHMIEKTADPLPDARTSGTVIIMSYDMMTSKLKELEIKSYYVVILDECHNLKDGKAKRTVAATKLAKKATRVIMLSGTPALSRPAELFSQIRLVNPYLFSNFNSFAVRYCDGKQGRYCFEAKGCTNSEELSAILSRRVMIRRLKNDVLTDLPDKRREVVYLSGPSIDSRMSSLQKAKSAFEANRSGFDKPGQNNDSLLEYFSQTGIVKAAAVCEHILDNYFHPDSPSRKVLIFGHHQIVLDTIQVEVHKRNLRSIRIDGQTPAKDRGALCKSFQEDESVVVAVLSMTAAGVGITLTAASVVVFAELHWNPGVLLQAEDRAHRVGQKDSVFVQYLVARNTADDAIWPMIHRKLEILGQVNLSSDTLKDADHTHMNCGPPDAKRRRSGDQVIFD